MLTGPMWHRGNRYRVIGSRGDAYAPFYAGDDGSALKIAQHRFAWATLHNLYVWVADTWLHVDNKG